MLELLLKFVMHLILGLCEIIVLPLSNLIFSFFPTVGEYFNYIMSFITPIFPYVATICHWFLIPHNALTLLFEYFVIKYSLYIGITGYQFAIRLYNKFKP